MVIKVSARENLKGLNVMKTNDKLKNLERMFETQKRQSIKSEGWIQNGTD